MKPQHGARAGSRRVHLVGAPLEGGVVHHVSDLVRFDPLGSIEVVLPPWPGLDRAARRMEEGGARVHRIPPAPRPGGVAVWLAHARVDLVHVHYSTPHDGTDAVESGLVQRIPVVSTDHVCAEPDAADPRWERRRRVAAAQAAIVADSRAVAAPLAARLGRPVRVLRHGIDPGRFERLPERTAARRIFEIPDAASVVGSIGALFSDKGMHRVLQASVGLGPRVVVLLVGEGPERSRLERWARDLGVEVRLPGWLEDVRPALAAMDVFALASDSEGLPTSILQAMAAGVPVVATDVGGVGEALGPYGTRVAAGDVAGFCAALAAALSGSLDGERHEAQERVRKGFDVRRLAQAVAALHQAVLAGDAPPPGGP